MAGLKQSLRGFLGRLMAPVRALAYEGATHGPRGKGWTAPGGGPNRSLNHSLPTLRNRIRQLYRNNPWVERAVEHNVVNEVGTGIKPMFLSQDEAFNAAAEVLWPRWAAVADAQGALNFYGQLVQAVRCRRVSGEAFIRRRWRPGGWDLPLPFQLQVIEPDQVPLDLNERRRNGNRIIAGKEYDRRARCVAIWIYPEHPGDGQYLGGRPIRVPAKDVIHHYLPLRPGQVRGEPDGVQALLRAKTYDSYEDAELTRKQTRAPFTGFLKRNYDGDSSWKYDPVSGDPIEGEDPAAMVNATPGTIITGEAGEELTLFDGDNTGSGYSDFQRQQLQAIASGFKSLYELTTGDWSKINDRLYRAMINEYRREIEQAQEHLTIAQICETVGRWFTDAAVLTGRLPVVNYAANRADYNQRDWSPQRWPHIHPTQDVAAIEKEMDLDLTSLEAEVAKRGKRASVVQESNVRSAANKQTLRAKHKIETTGDNA